MDPSRLVKLSIFILLFSIEITKCTGQKSHQNQQYFRVKPQDVNAIEKETIVLNCEVGNLGGLVQWSKDGFLLGYESQIPGYPRYSIIRDVPRGSFNLQIKRVQLDDEGDYQCQVGPNAHHQPIRASSIVSVNVPPQELMLTSSSSIFLPFKNLNTELNPSDPSAILPSLNMSQQESSFNSSIQHLNFNQLLNQLMTNSNENKLAKKLSKYRPSLPFIQLREAERLTLICNTSTPTKPETKLVLLRNGLPIREDQYSMYIKSGLGSSGRLSATRASLTVFIKATEEGAIYTCAAQNDPKIMLSVRISVLMPPSTPVIEGYKEDEPIIAGDSLTLACLCKAGNPPAQLKWLRDEQILISNSQTIVRQQKKQIKSPTKEVDDLIDQSDNFWIELGAEETIEYTKLTANRLSDVTRTLSIQVKPEDHYTTYSCQAINQHMFAHHFRSNIASVRLSVQYPPTTIQLIGDRSALISQANSLLKFSCAIGPSNPSAQVQLMIDGEPLEINFKLTEMHYSTDHNSMRTSNSLNLEQLLIKFDKLNRKLNGFVNVANYSTSLNKIFIDKQRQTMQRKRQIKVHCSASHPLLQSPISSEYDLQLLFPPSAPVLKVEPNNAQFAGQYKRFTCSSSGGNPVAKLQFYEQQEGKTDRIILQSTSSSTSNRNSISTLELLLKPSENGATIGCEVQSPALLTASFVQKQIEVYFFNQQLNLTTETQIRSLQETSANYDEWKINDEFTLVCRAGPCNPACNLDWFLNTNKLSLGIKRFRITNEQSVSTNNGGIITVSRLNINSVQIVDHGHEIECHQSNTLFNQTTKRNYIVKVLHRPIFDANMNLDHFEVWENETLQLEFQAKGHPNAITYEFYYDSIRLSKSNFFQIHGSKIIFKNLAISFGGQYEVHAINSQGKAVHRFTVNVLYSPKLIKATTLLYLDRNINQTVKINCTVAANPIKELKSEWQKLILFEKFISQNNDIIDARLDNDVMYSTTENEEQQNYSFTQPHQIMVEKEDENEFLREKLAHSYLWHLSNLEWWWPSPSAISTAAAFSSANIYSSQSINTNGPPSVAEVYKPFIALNSSVNYNQKVISKNNQMLIITSDKFTTKPNQQKYHLATASLLIEPPFLNDTDYLCSIQSNPPYSSKATDAIETPSTKNYYHKQLSFVTRIAVRQKRPPLLILCNSLEIPVLLRYLREQVVDYWNGKSEKSGKSHEQVTLNQIYRGTININNNDNNQRSILVAAEPGDTISFYCTAVRGAILVQFSWRDVKHGQLLGAISHTFVQPNFESNWRRALNITASQTFSNNNINSGLNPNNFPTIPNRQQSLDEPPPSTKSDLNSKANYTVKIHFNPRLPELITAELRLNKINLDHFSTQFQCLVSNELGSDSGIYQVKRKSVPEHVEQVHVKQLNNNRLLITWKPGFDGGLNQQYIVKFALKSDLERVVQSKQLVASTHTMYDLQNEKSVNSHESLDEIKKTKSEIDENDVLTVEEQEEERINKEVSREPDINELGESSTAADLHWRTDQDRQTTVEQRYNNKRKNMKKRFNIKWNGYLLSSNGPLAQMNGNERLVSNETQIEFTDLKPSTDYYFTVLSKNRIGLAKKHSIPILIRTPKADLNQENNSPSDQVQSNLQLGENSLGLIEYGLLTNSSANLTIWLLILVACAVVLVNATIFAVYYCRKRAAKLTGSLTSADTVTTAESASTACTNSTHCTTLSSGCDENQIELNEKQTITNDNKEILSATSDNLTKKTNTTEGTQHCIMNSSDYLLSNKSLTLMTDNPSTLTTNSLNSSIKSNRTEYLKQPIVNNQSANLVYAQLRSDNRITSNLIHSNNFFQSNLIQNKTIGNNYNYAAISPFVHQLDNGSLTNGFDSYNLNSKNFSKSSLALKAKMNRLSLECKEIPYFLNENLISGSFEPELSWSNNMITDFYPTNVSKLASNGLLSSCTPSPSTITYSSQLPHLMASSSLTTNSLSPIDHLTPSTVYSYRTMNSNHFDDSQLKLKCEQSVLPSYANSQSSIVAQTLNRNQTTSSDHFLTSDFNHQNNYNGIQNYNTLQSSNSSKANLKKSPHKNHCKVVSFQKPVECWLLENEKDNYHKQ